MRSRLAALLPYAILLLVLLVAYLPVCTFYFGMKNDAFSDNFPNKFFLSEAIHAGQLPLWNPYMNFGLPIYADMGFAFYNPITWVFASIGYNAYTLTAEVLLYVYLGGIFMLRLARFLGLTSKINLVVAAMYMCSGFYTGCLQYINFLTAAAFLPLVLQTLLQLFNHPSFKSSFWFATACYAVFAGGHPAIPIALLYFLAMLVFLLFIFSPQYQVQAKNICFSLAISLGLMVLLYLPALYGYVTILPFYARGGPAQQALTTEAGFTPWAWISFFFPFATAANTNFFVTDVAMRNGFFGVAGFVCVVLSLKSKQLYARVLLIAALLMLLLSTGGWVKEVLFSKMPLLQYVRYNGEYRVFSLLCFCVLAGFGLRKLEEGEKPFTLYFKRALMIVAISCCCILITFAATNAVGFNALFAKLHQPLPAAQKIKAILAGSLPVFLMASAALTLLVTVLSFIAVQKHRFNLLVGIVLCDVVFNCMIYLPVTGVGQVTLQQIQAVYNTSPKGIPIPPLVPINNIHTLDAKTTGLVGDATYYNKLIGTTKLTDYPSYFTSTAAYFNNRPIVNQVSKHPFVFTKTAPSTGAITIQQFSPTVIHVLVNTPASDTLVLLQNNYRFWHATVNGQKVPIATMYTTFLSVKINKGANDVVFYYQDRWLGFYLLISLAVLIVSLSVVARQSITGKSPVQYL